MPRHDRVLVRYRLPESDQWSALHWCDIEKNTEDGGIQVRVAPAKGSSMPADSAFKLLPPEQAKKLLVWDVSTEPAPSAYCFVFQANTMYRFDFNPMSNLFMAFGKPWSWETQEYDKEQPPLSLQQAFKTELTGDRRLAMRTHDNYNYNLLTEVVGDLLASLQPQYVDWKQVCHLQEIERQRRAEIAVESERQKKLAIETQQKLTEEAARKRQETAERNHQPDVVRTADRQFRETLVPRQDLDEDAALAFQLQMGEMGGVEEPFPFHSQPIGNNNTLSDTALAERLQYEELCRNGAAERQNPSYGTGRPAAFFSDRTRQFPPRRPPAQASHLFLMLTGAALCAYGISIAFTSPWVGIGLLAIGALLVCAAVLGRLPPPQNRPAGATVPSVSSMGAFRMM